MSEKNKTSISEEIALVELRNFLKDYKKREFRKGLLTDEKLWDDYPDILDALMDGKLILKEGVPTYTLRHPVGEKSKEGLSNIVFKTRIKPSTQSRLMDGLNIQKQTAKYALKLMAHITGLTGAELDLLDKEDYDTIQQICSVFS